MITASVTGLSSSAGANANVTISVPSSRTV